MATNKDIILLVARLWYYFGKLGVSMKTDLVKIRVSESEKEAFQTAADIAGITVSAWARERLRRAAVRDLQDASRPIPFLERQNGNR